MNIMLTRTIWPSNHNCHREKLKLFYEYVFLNYLFCSDKAIPGIKSSNSMDGKDDDGYQVSVNTRVKSILS